VIGERQSGRAEVLRELYKMIDAPVYATSFEVAELSKFADNSFHALKVAFANEIGRFALQSGISPTGVSEIFLADAKLNLSSAYLQPGAAFGGPCLPKDVRALAKGMKNAGISAPVIENIFASNSLHSRFLLTEIQRRVVPPSRILLVGLTFKAGTDDLRGSSLVSLAEALLDGGYRLTIYDPDLGEKGYSGPSRRIAEAITLDISAVGAFDLVVVGKNFSEIKALIRSQVEIFHIEKL
jgi:GDP-mannose 6-dehydrogenase